jgi:hypothetical protein
MFSLILDPNMEEKFYSETSVDFQETTDNKSQ